MAEQSVKDNPASARITSDSRLASGNNEPRLNIFWRITIVLVAVTLIWLLIGALAHARFGSDYHRQAHLMRALLTSLLVIPLIAWSRRFLDRRPWSGLGLTGLRTGWRPLLIGMVCWLIPAAIGTLFCLLLGWTRITPLASLAETISLAFGLVVLVFIYEALPEELIFRGYFYRNLAAAVPLWMAILIQALLFTLWGFANGGENSLERSLLFFTFAVIVAVFRAVTGSLWAAIGFHLAFQTVAQLFGTVGNQFIITNPQSLMLFAFGVFPFAVALTLLSRFYKTRPDWHDREPDLSLQPSDHA